MTQHGGQQLAAFSEAVRESTIKRLALVPGGSENWRVDPEAMSFADIVGHLIDSDRWLFQALASGAAIEMVGHPHTVRIEDRGQYDDLLRDLRESGSHRSSVLSGMRPDDFERPIRTSDGGTVTAWWTILRSGIDHEVHHRGQVVAYLRVLGVKASA